MADTEGYRLSRDRVRTVTAAELGLSTQEASSGFPGDSTIRESEGTAEFERILEKGIGRRVRELIGDGFGAIVFVGPPGTGKSWYAEKISLALVSGDTTRRRIIQFHAAYEYEDFVEGFVPREGGEFVLVDKHLIAMCNVASSLPDHLCLLVIDELSRANVARVFGEALTYLEKEKRDSLFYLASGRELVIPPNLILLATMNSFDRGVADIDLALERRFARVELQGDPEALAAHLEAQGLRHELADAIVRYFGWLQRNRNHLARIGHAYFFGVTSGESLARRWEHQLKAYFERIFDGDAKGLEEVEQRWIREVGPLLE